MVARRAGVAAGGAEVAAGMYRGTVEAVYVRRHWQCQPGRADGGAY